METATPPTVEYLSGRAWKRALPVLHAPPQGDAPALKRLLLTQGELAQVHDDHCPIRYIACIELRPGSVRGNHFHNVKQEFVYILQGDATLLVEARASKVRESIPVSTGDLVFIAAGLAHCLQVQKAGFAIEFSEAKFDPADIHRYPMV